MTYKIFKNIIFFPIILVHISTPLYFFFDLESLSQESPGLDPFSIYFMAL